MVQTVKMELKEFSPLSESIEACLLKMLLSYRSILKYKEIDRQRQREAIGIHTAY